jgi:hypothetical protein
MSYFAMISTFQISWVRRRDWHILTNGLLTFTTDSRFKVLYKEGSFNWVLQVKSYPVLRSIIKVRLRRSSGAPH